MNLAGRRAVVVGLGVSGHAAAIALARHGARVRVTEMSAGPEIERRAAELRALGVEVETGRHDLQALDADLAVVSPGVPPHAPVLRALARAGVKLISELELGARLARCDLIAVTGTNGKTTTTGLIAHMLETAGVEALAAGNIGLPLTEAAGRVGPGGVLAVEASSFQLQLTQSFHPRVAVVLNIAEDHIDWHGSVEAYARAKARITANQGPGDALVANRDDERAWAIARASSARVVAFSGEEAPPGGAGPSGGWLVCAGRRVLELEALPLPGRAGVEDAAAACAAALSYGLDADAVARALVSWRPLAHRLEVVARANGVTYIDDSKATNPHATLAALKGLSDVVLIAGGRSKGMDLSALAAAAPPVVAAVVLGEAAGELERVFGGVVPVESVATMDEAVTAAARHARRGGSVLLSPACASLDMYRSYAERGADFARAVRELIGARAGTTSEGSEVGG